MIWRVGNPARRRGSTLIVTLWVSIALVGVVLVLGHSVRVEATAAANRLARVQADAALRGAEQWLLSVVETEITTPGSAADVQMQERPIGDCLVWVIRPHAEDPQQFDYGLTDEAGKVDLNTATPEMLIKLPGITQEAVDSIVDWRDADSIENGQGAEDNYYLNGNNHPDFPEAYKAKNADFESPDELRLVRGMFDDVLFGADRNHNGLIDQREVAAAGTALAASNGTGRGIYPFVTVYGVRATSSTTTSVSAGSSTGGVVDINSTNQNRLQTLLQNNVSGKAQNILDITRRQRPFNNVFDWYFRVGLTQDEFSKIFTQLTANAPAAGGTSQPAPARRTAKVNVMTAPREVLLCLPGLEEDDVQQILSERARRDTTTPGDLSWIVGVLSQQKLVGTGTQEGIGGLITGTSKIYSADIVAVSADGRAFKRARIVIDGRTTPAKIIYRRDMTTSGWPLPGEIREALRAGTGTGFIPMSGVTGVGGSATIQRGTMRS